MKSKLSLVIISAIFLLSLRNFDPRLKGSVNLTFEHKADELLLELEEEAVSNLHDLKAKLAATIPEIESIRDFSTTPYLLCRLPLNVNGYTLNRAIFKLRQLRAIRFYSLNYIFRVAEKTPNDEYFKYQYWLKNSGQLIHPTDKIYGTAGADIKATQGWEYSSSGEDIIIAVLDTGLFFEHEDLKSKYVTGYDFINERLAAIDDNGHGTAVSAVIAAETNNNLGIAGITWKSKIMPLKVCDHNGSGTLKDLALAIRYAAERGVKIINIGLELNVDSPVLEEACKYAFDRGIILIAAAGNSQGPVAYPAAYDNYVLAVSATDENDIFASFSNRGPQIDLSAPGTYIFSASFNPSDPTNHRYYTYYKRGTSFSAAMVSAAAALVLGYKPFLKNNEVYNLLRYTADDINRQNFPGKDIYLGYGRLNLKTLLEPYQLQK